MFNSFDVSGVWELFSSFLNSFAPLLGVAVLAGVKCGCGCNHDDENSNGNCKGQGDNEKESVYKEIETKIDELKSQLQSVDNSSKNDVRRELGDTILELAIHLQQDEYLEEADEAYLEASEHLDAIVQDQPDNDEIRRLCGLTHLSHAVVLNDMDEKEDAIEEYEEARKILEPLESKGDGEAKYDIAGIKLNQGILFHELGELDKAFKLLDESFTEFRALEKISELDTRYYMGKVSVALANLFRDQNEPIEKIVDMYNRSMRLFVELVDAGDIQHELDLANALIDKCTARYDAAVHSNTRDISILDDMRQGLQILEKLVAEDNHEAYFDRFGALMSYAIMLDEFGQHEEALKTFNEVQEKYKEWENADDPMILNEYAELYERRGQCLANMEKIDEAIQNISKSIELREKFWEEEWALTSDELVAFAPSLASSYCNRAMLYDKLGKSEMVVADCKSAMNVLEPYKDDLDDDFDELVAQIEKIEKNKK